MKVTKHKSELKKVVAVIQARIGSTRLPGKVLKKINGKTIIAIIAERLRGAKRIDDIVLAIPRKRTDDLLAKEGSRLGLKVFRGSEIDVTSRMLGAARLTRADAIVRVTADCPLIDPAIIDKVIDVFKNHPKRYDYLGNVFVHTFPVGLGVELFTVSLLKKLMIKLKTPAERELIFTYVITNWPISRIYNLQYKKNLSHIRLTLDWPEDLRLIRLVYRGLAKQGKIFILEDILRFIDKNRNILEINKNRVDREQLLNPRYEKNIKKRK